MLTPHMFIGGAEKTGLIIPMGYWALEQACQQIQEWERNNTHFIQLQSIYRPYSLKIKSSLVPSKAC